MKVLDQLLDRFYPLFVLAVVTPAVAAVLWVSSRDFPVHAQPQPVPRTLAIFSTYDLASSTFIYCNTAGTSAVECSTGAAAEDGWVAVQSETQKSIQVQVDALTATSAEFIIQGRLSGGSGLAAQIWPAAGDRSILGTEDPISFMVTIPDAIFELRVGMKITTDTAGAESITVVYNAFE